MPCPIALPFRRKNSTYRLCGLAIVWHAITASHKRILMASSQTTAEIAPNGRGQLARAARKNNARKRKKLPSGKRNALVASRSQTTTPNRNCHSRASVAQYQGASDCCKRSPHIGKRRFPYWLTLAAGFGALVRQP